MHHSLPDMNDDNRTVTISKEDGNWICATFFGNNEWGYRYGDNSGWLDSKRDDFTLDDTLDILKTYMQKGAWKSKAEWKGRPDEVSESWLTKILGWGFSILVIATIVGLFGGNDSSNNATALVSSDGQKLYNYYKSFDGNQDTAGYAEEEFIDGEILNECKIGNKYPAYFGWFTSKTTFIMGQPIENPETIKMYVAVIDNGDSIRGVWRGEEYVDALYEYLATKGCILNTEA